MALAYVVLTFAISYVLFGSSHFSTESLVLNFIMIALVLLMMPILAEFMANVRSLLSINSVDIGYVAKRLNRTRTTDAGLKELASFLADHLHFSYIGIMMGDKLHGSKDVEFTAKEIEIVAIETKSTPDQACRRLKGEEDNKIEYGDLKAVVELKGADGKPFGKIVLGSPYRDRQFDDEDFSQLEMVIGFVATAIDPKLAQEDRG
jgi:hypothetical protein